MQCSFAPKLNFPTKKRLFLFCRESVSKRSPLDFVRVHKRILRFLGFFEYHIDSKLGKAVHTTCMITSRAISLYLGCALQYLALLNYKSVLEVTTIISVGTVYLNIAVKDIVFALKRNDIAKLWQRFEDEDFKAKDINELK